MSNNVRINFVFFHVKKTNDEKKTKNKIHEHNEEDISLFISSIKRNHPESKIIQCSDFYTPKIEGIDKILRKKINLDKIMEERIAFYSTLKLSDPSVFLDTDMLLVKKIPLDQFLDKADVFLLKRSYDVEGNVPKLFRGQIYKDHLSGTLGQLYPYIGCFVITKNIEFWKNCYKIYKRLDKNYKFWFGDQKVFKEIVDKKIHKFAFLNESDFACPPRYINENKNPFLIHFKGKNSKYLIKDLYYQIYNKN